MKTIIITILLLCATTAFCGEVKPISFIPFNQLQFDDYLKNDKIVIVKFIEDEIPIFQRPLVKMLIRTNGVIKMQGKGLKVNGNPFLGIFTKNTRILFYGRHKK